jgi:hypothetical protein
MQQIKNLVENSTIMQLAKTQERLHACDRLTNCIAKLNSKQAKEVAYLIHRICEAKYKDVRKTPPKRCFNILRDIVLIS